MEYQCYQILIVTTEGEAIVLEEDGIVELISDFSTAKSMDDLFLLIENLFPCLEELSDAQFDFFKRLAEIKDLSELIKIETTSYLYNEYPDNNSVFDEETGLYVSTESLNYNFIDKQYYFEVDESFNESIDKRLDIDFKDKIVAVSGFPYDAMRIGLENWLISKGATIQNYVSSQTDYLIFNPDHIRYTRKFRYAQHLISKGEKIKMLSCREQIWYIFTEYVMPPIFEYVDKTHTVLKSYNGLETDVVIPDGVRVVGRYSFSGHFRIKSITFPESVVEIEDNAFGSLHKCLERVSLPPKLKTLSSHGWNPFCCCEKLKNISVGKESENIIFDQNCLIEKRRSTYLNGLIELKNILVCGNKDSIIPDYVTCIGDHAFACLKDFKKIKLPSALKYIFNSAFSWCFDLEEVIIPYGVEYIGNFAFNRCINLKRVYIPSTVNEIKLQAFWESDNVTLHIENNLYAEEFAQTMNIPYIRLR